MASGEAGNEYRIVFARSARKELENLPRAVSARIMGRIEALALNPRPPDRFWKEVEAETPAKRAPRARPGKNGPTSR